MKIITVNTRHGAGGHWCVDFESKLGPRNLLRAAKEMFDEIDRNRGVGGYHTNLQIDDVPIDAFALQELNLKKAKEICADPERFAA